MTPVLSLVTGTMNRSEGFARLVRTIRERTSVSWELIVSDATDPRAVNYTKQYQDRLGDSLTLRLERPREGCVKGYNWCFGKAKGKWVIWLNDDAEVMPGYDVAAISFMEAHPQIGLGALYYAEATLPYCVNMWLEMGYANFGIIDRELGEKIGWFDDVVQMYGNDNSLAFRVLLEGKGIGSIKGSRIWHHSIMDKGKIDNQALRYIDAPALVKKYQDRIPQMQATFREYRDLFGPLRIGD